MSPLFHVSPGSQFMMYFTRASTSSAFRSRRGTPRQGLTHGRCDLGVRLQPRALHPGSLGAVAGADRGLGAVEVCAVLADEGLLAWSKHRVWKSSAVAGPSLC